MLRRIEKGDYGVSRKRELVNWEGDGNMKTFVGFVQFLSDKTVATLRSTASVAHPIHANLPNIVKCYSLCRAPCCTVCNVSNIYNWYSLCPCSV